MTIEHKLSSLAGIKPTPEWLAECQLNIRRHSNNSVNSSIEEDEVLHQILHTDLRNVIRYVADDENDSNDDHDDRGDVSHSRSSSNSTNNTNCWSILLRQSITKSMSITKSTQQTMLPPNFHHMVQIEELLDISKNAEDRLALGPSSLTSPTPIGNQKCRCLKLLISDGYCDNGKRTMRRREREVSRANQKQHFVAMEIQPIPDISAHSKAGMKMILSGPIIIHKGILFLDRSNTIILGGYIPDLVPIQIRARERAAKVAGVGIDPTFKALVWNPEYELEEENDEGELESSDVQISPTGSIILQSNNSNNNNNYNNDGVSSDGSNIINSSWHQRNNHHINSYLQQQQKQQDPSEQPSNYLAQLQQSRNNDVSVTTRQSAAPNLEHRTTTSYYNQILYTSSNVSNNGMTNGETTNIRTNATTSQGTNHVHNIYSTNPNNKSMNSNNSNSNVPQEQYQLTISNTKQSVVSNNKTVTCQNNTDNHQLSTNATIEILSPNLSSTKEETSSSLTAAVSQFKKIPLSPTALSEPLSFLELHTLLQNMISNPNTYNQYINTTFIVPCKLHSHQRHKGNMQFDIERNKDYKKKVKDTNKKSSSEKYSFVMVCQMTGANEENGAITCKITHDYIRPFISMGASEMRKLHREDKAQANKVANEGGKQIISDLRNLESCKLMLLHSKEDFFDDTKETSPFYGGKPRCIDGIVPILKLCCRNN